MPMRRKKTSANFASYPTLDIWKGPMDHPDSVRIDASMLQDEVDEDGMLKPGLPLTEDGTLVGDGGEVYGVTLEPVKVGTEGTYDITVGCSGLLIRGRAEDALQRDFTAAEVAGFDAAQCLIKLV